MTFATATIQERIRTARCLRGLSQRAFAKAVGVGQSAIWLWETGKTKPQPNSILRASQALRVSMLWLTFGVGPMEAPITEKEPVVADSSVSSDLAS